MERQTVFPPALLLTLPDSTELICSTVSLLICFVYIELSFDVFNITINNVFNIKMNYFVNPELHMLLILSHGLNI